MINFFLGFIASIGFCRLFYAMNKPTGRQRSIALLAVVILWQPLFSLWHDSFSPDMAVITIIVEALALAACVLLGARRKRMFTAAAFVFCLLNIVELPVTFFIAVIIQPFSGTLNPIEAMIQTPQIYYCALFFFNAGITVCCFLAARWLRKTQVQPQFKAVAVFSLFFIIFDIIQFAWYRDWADWVNIIPDSLLACALFSLLMVLVQLGIFYLFTLITAKNDAEGFGAGTAPSPVSGEYSQFLEQLSRRELEVIESALAGCFSYKKIAAELNISDQTVKSHLRHIYQVTGVSGISALCDLFYGYASGNPQ